MTLKQLQTEHAEWMRHNFGDGVDPWRPILGLIEELGEISHAYLKWHDGIRISENHLADMRDGVGDVMIFLAGFATTMGFDLEEVVTKTWEKIKQRDWKDDPDKGVR